MTLAEALALGRSYCSGSDTAQLDAQLLLGAVLKVNQAYLMTWPERVLSDTEHSHYLEKLKLRQAGQPIAYILGYKDFWTLRLQVNEHTLIPRPETELLVETSLKLITGSEAYILELGTGSGAIALALASERPHWHILATDKCQKALQIAQNNQQAHALHHVTFKQSDWFQQLDFNKKVDLIVSNPPYIHPQDKHLKEGDLRFEPSSALVAKQQGMADIIQIIDEARLYLKRGGWLCLEHGYDQASKVQCFFKKYGYNEIQSVYDLGQQLRVTYARW